MTLRNLIIDSSGSTLHNVQLSAGTTHYLYLKTPGVSEANSLILNGGGNGTTDWIDSNFDGLANNWHSTGIVATCSIIDGTEGFSNRAQKVVCARTGVTADQIYIDENSYVLLVGVTYILRFDYKSNVDLHLNDVNYSTMSSFSASPTSVTSVNATITTNVTSSYIFFAMAGIPALNDWFILDNVNLYRQ